MKRLGKRLRSYILLAVVVCSVFANLFVNYSETHAATDPATLYLAPEILKDATNSIYRVSIALCLTNDGGGNLTSGIGSEISPGDTVSGKWFNGGTNHTVRPGIMILGNADDNIDCSTFIKNHPVAASLGFQDNIALACGVGLVRKDGKDCLNDPDQSNFTDKNISGNKNKVYAALDAHYKNSSTPPSGGLNDVQRYLIVAKTFTEYCQATAQANVGGSKATPVIQAQYKDNKANVVDGNGDVTNVYFDIPHKGEDTHLGNNENDFTYRSASCGDLLGLMNQYSGAYATYVKAHPQTQASPAPTTNPNNSGNDSPPTCTISGIGWIVCPVMRFMSQVTDQAYGVVSDMLTTPALDTGTGGAMYQAWSIMRNFANVAFVIAFLIIIYAQITGFGVSNYGIKKLLPRIIVAAILVNVSYWICAIAVDVSNILGSSLKGLLEGAGKQLYVSGQDFTKTGSPGWDALTVSVIAGTATVAVLSAGLSVLIPILLMALLAIVTVVIVLTARQAIIILLVVISPLAFVAYLLPNTDSWFKRWRELFTSLLMMFPIIAVVFGACSLASSVLMQASTTQSTNPTSGFMVMVLHFMAAGVTIIPLAITPILMKTTTGVLGKIGGFVNDPNKGLFDRMNKGAQSYRGYRQNVRGAKALSGNGKVIGAGHFKRVQNRNLRNTAAQNNLQSAQAQFGVTNAKAAGYTQASALSQAQTNAINNANNTRFVTSVANNPGLVSTGMGSASDDELVKNALDAQQKKAIADAIKDAEITANIPPGDLNEMGSRLEEAVKNNDSITARAMQNMLLQSGSKGLDTYRNSLNKLEGKQTTSGEDTLTSSAMTEMRTNLLQNHSGVKAVAADLTAHAAQSKNIRDLSAVSNDASTWQMSDAELVHQKPTSVSFAANSGAISKEQAMRIDGNEELAKHLDKNSRDMIKIIANLP